jgi:hypothetical protein
MLKKTKKEKEERITIVSLESKKYRTPKTTFVGS